MEGGFQFPGGSRISQPFHFIFLPLRCALFIHDFVDDEFVSPISSSFDTVDHATGHGSNSPNLCLSYDMIPEFVIERLL